MERSLHRRLKERYGLDVGGRTEVVLGEFRIDALGPDGRLIEIQSGPLGLLKRKLARLLPNFEVTVVKPIILSRRVIRRDEPAGVDLGTRRSPKRGSALDVFDELVGLIQFFPHVNLRIDLVAVEVDEIRVPRRRKPGYLVVDQILHEVVETIPLRCGHDLWSLLPDDLSETFTTQELAGMIGRSIEFAQRVAYCLRLCGAADVVAKVGNRRLYSRASVASLG